MSGRRCKTPVKGPLPFGAWVNIYEARDESRFELDDREELAFDRRHGFFTWIFDFEKRYLLIPKMCGDGRYWRPHIFAMVKALRKSHGCIGAYCVTKRDPRVYMRVLGGELVKQERESEKTYSYILVTPENTRVKEGTTSGKQIEIVSSS